MAAPIQGSHGEDASSRVHEASDEHVTAAINALNTSAESIISDAGLVSPQALLEARVAHLGPIASFWEFIQCRPDATDEMIRTKYATLPENLRNHIEGALYWDVAFERGKETLTDPQYGEHAVEADISVLRDICSTIHLISPTLAKALDTPSTSEADLEYLFSRQYPDTKNRIYEEVFTCHAKENGKGLVHDLDSVPFGKDYAQKNPSAISGDLFVEPIVATLEDAIQSGSEEEVRYLLEGILQSKDLAKEALYFSLETGRTDFFMCLFPHVQPDVTRDDLETCVSQFGVQGNGDGIQFLHSHGVRTTVRDYEQLFELSALNGDVDLLNYLFSLGRFPSRYCIQEMASCAAQFEHFDFLTTMIQAREHLPMFSFESAIENAARHHREDLFRFLLLNETYSASYDPIFHGLMHSVRSRFEAGIRILLESIVDSLSRDFLSRDFLSLGISVSLAENRPELVPLFTTDFSILSDRNRELSILSCARYGYIDILEQILQHGPITSALQGSAITNAQGPRAGEIRDMLRMAAVEEGSVSTTPHASASSHSSSGASSPFLVVLDDVEANPLPYLEKIFTEGFPARVHIAGSSAVDLGGITKQFITTLVSALFTSKHIRLSSSNIPMVLEGTSPTTLQMFGKMCADIHTRNATRTDRFLIGAGFNEVFFELLQKVAQDDTEEKKYQKAALAIKSHEPDLDAVCTLILNPSDAAAKAHVEAIFPGDDPHTEAKAILKEYVDAAEAFLDGVPAGSLLKQHIAAKAPSALAKELQGEKISKERLLAALKKGDTLSAERFQWVQDFISEADEATRIAFVHAITGNDTLSPGNRIEVRKSWRENTAEIHTCFNSIDVPQEEDITKEMFFGILEGAISGSGYNIA